MADDVLDALKIIVFIFASLVVINIVTSIAGLIRSFNVISNLTIGLTEIFIFSVIILVIYLQLKKL